MPIPNDGLKREWIDASNNNPELVKLYRPCLIAFLAFNRDHVPSIAGSGFIIGAQGEYAIAITAKHVLTEGALNIQRPKPRHAASAISMFIPKSSTTPSLKESELRACWMGEDNADLLFTRYAGYNDSSDIACTIFEAQPQFKKNFKPSNVLLDANEPSKGDVVHMISLDKFEISNYSPPTHISGSGYSFSMNRRVSIRVGTVTEVYPKGHRHYDWPCFTTSIPAEPGMSGGMVFVPRDNKSISICGIVSADASTEEARANNALCGESIISSAWMALGLQAPQIFQHNPPLKSIYELMKNGQIFPALGIENISYIELEDGDGIITNHKK